MTCQYEGIEYENIANYAFLSDYILIVNIFRDCKEREIIKCEKGTQVWSRFEFDNKNCKF